MSDAFAERDFRELSKINLNEEWELAYWSEKFDVTADELKQAVREVGAMARDVERHLLRHQRLSSQSQKA